MHFKFDPTLIWNEVDAIFHLNEFEDNYNINASFEELGSI